MRALYNILRVIFGVKSCKKRFFIFVAVKIFLGKSNDDNFVVCGDSLRGSAGQRSMRESNRCDGAQCAHQFFRERSPTPRRTYTQLFSLSYAFSVLNFYSYAFFLQKSLLLLLFWSLLSGFLTIQLFRPRL